MKRKNLYLVLAIVGFLVPYYFFVSFLRTYGLDGRVFVRELFDTSISTFFAADLIISCLVFLVYLRQETKRNSMRYSWIYVIALLTVGLSFALPLFLYARETHLEKAARSA
jgi:uncharacterized protein DUF2834